MDSSTNVPHGPIDVNQSHNVCSRSVYLDWEAAVGATQKFNGTGQMHVVKIF